MSGDPFKKLRKGDAMTMSEQAYGRLMDLAKVPNVKIINDNKTSDAVLKNATVIKIANVSGEKVPMFGTLGIDGPAISPEDDESAFVTEMLLKGVTPNSDDHSNRYVVVLEPIDHNGVGKAVIAGVTICKINKSAEDDDPDFVDIVDGQNGYLEESSSGNAQVLWLNSGIGEQYGLIRIGGGGGSSCPAQNEKFTVYMLGQVSSETFQLGIDGESTTDLEYDSTAAEIEAGLEALSNVGAGNVMVTGSGFPESSMIIEFIGDLSETKMPPMHCNNNLVGVGAGLIIVPHQTGGPNEF